MTDFLTAEVTVLNDELRTHYGMPTVGSNDFSEVSLVGTDRRGILTHGSILTVTSHPNRTSPVKRGAFVLAQLLCAPPPPPPANVEGLAEPTGPAPITLRARLEQHRADPACASCHQLMDPIGLGLENFDLLGGFRTIDPSGLPIDASATMITGESIYGAISLSQVIATDARFLECLTTKLSTYATGRTMGESDRFRIRRLTRIWQGAGYSLPELITEIVLSDMFQNRRPS